MQFTLAKPYLYIHIQKQTTMDAILQELSIGRKQRYALYQKGYIRINEKTIKQSIELTKKDTICIFIEEELHPIPCYPKPLSIAYEDDLFLIVNKPAKLLVHSDGTNTDETLHSMVQYYYQCQKIKANVHAIHRLDKDTTGLVIYCKIALFQPMLDAMLQEKAIQRIYLALCKGRLEKNRYSIEKAIARDRHDAKKMRVSKKGQYAYTSIFCKKRYKDYSLIECHLKTGRTHQIRVHCASIQHPLLSDALYGTKDKRIQRCALHAWKIQLFHPLTKELLEVECPLPNDMQKLVTESGNT